MSANERNVTVIDVDPPRRRRRWIWLFVALVLLLVSFSRIVSVYLSALWFGSLGYSSVYWYIFKAKAFLFAGFTWGATRGPQAAPGGGSTSTVRVTAMLVGLIVLGLAWLYAAAIRSE